MNILSQFVSDHPIAAVVVGVIVVSRILTRDIKQANKFIDEVNAERTTISEVWSGIDRRSPNRAKNVVRPAFGQVTPVAQKHKIVDAGLKTGTDN